MKGLIILASLSLSLSLSRFLSHSISLFIMRFSHAWRRSVAEGTVRAQWARDSTENERNICGRRKKERERIEQSRDGRDDSGVNKGGRSGCRFSLSFFNK